MTELIQISNRNQNSMNHRYSPDFRAPYSIVCPECNGAGVVEIPDGDGEEVWLLKERCDKCDGHGQIEDDSEPEFDKYEND